MKREIRYSLEPIEKATFRKVHLTSYHESLINDLDNICRKEYGLNLLCGKKGSGKTSVMNIVENKKIYDKSIWIHVNLYNCVDNIALAILYQIERNEIIIQNEILIQNTKLLIKSFENNVTITQTERTGEELIASQTETKDSSSSIHSKAEIGLKGHILKILSNFKIEFSKIHRFKSFNERKKIKTKGMSFDMVSLNKYTNRNKYDELFKLFDLCDLKKIKLILIIDEADKFSCKDVLNFVLENKLLLVEQKILTFILTDIYQGIEMEMFHKDYFSDIIYMPFIEYHDFFMISKNFELSNSLEEHFEYYYLSRANYRELVYLTRKEKYSIDKKNSHIREKSWILIILVSSDFFRELDNKYKQVILDYLIYFIDYIFLFKEISFQVVNEHAEEYFVKTFQDNQVIKNLLLRVNEWLKTTPFSLNNLIVYPANNMMTTPKTEMFNEFINNTLKDTFCLIDKKTENFSIYNFYNYYNSILVQSQKSINALYSKYEKSEFYDSLQIKSEIENYIITLCETKYFPPYIYNNQIEIDYDRDNNSVDDAIKFINNFRNKIIGVVLLVISVNKKKLINGVIYYSNELTNCAKLYVGYPGLSSHKEYKHKEFIEFLELNKIKYFYPNDNVLFNKTIDVYSTEEMKKEIIPFVNMWFEMIKNNGMI
ncbi:hypothetical protein [Anaerorhabdus sp.]|uniref:hypothetical protein n=1 Tax=Anaerorhabdus sp. TaxID=1872524 RepID=UPI002FC7B156